MPDFRLLPAGDTAIVVEFEGDISPRLSAMILALADPRSPTPRSKLPAGSVAITNNMTCIFPLESPCGWHVIGRSPVALWDRACRAGALLCAGDRVSFSPVSLREYERLAAQAAAG